jgi:uncharacterized protein (DUF1501 family)
MEKPGMFSRRKLLAAGGLGVLFPYGVLAARKAGGSRVITIFASGGWDVSYCLDPKIGVSTIDGPELDEDEAIADDREAIETFGDIPIAVNDIKRPEVRLFFEKWASRAAVVNGISVGSLAHADCTLRVLTGSRSAANADLGAITGYTYGQSSAIPYMDVGGSAFTGSLAAYSGRSGYRNQIKMVLDRSNTYPPPADFPFNYPQFIPEDAALKKVRELLRTRAQRRWDTLGASGRNYNQLNNWWESQTRAEQILEHGEQLAASLPFKTQQKLSEQAALAVDMIAGQLCHTVALNSGESWDTHDGNISQHDRYNHLFFGLNTLMLELENASMLDDTVIVVMSEMSRTPRRNADAGKDHWPVTSALIIGGGLGGRVLGATDDNLDAKPIDLATGDLWDNGAPLRYDELFAGLLEHLDIDPGDWLPNVTPYGGLSG